MEEQKTIIEELNSIYTLKYFLQGCSAYRYKNINVKNLEKEREKIVEKAKLEWKRFRYKKAPKKVVVKWRILNKHAKNEFDESYKKLYQKIDTDAELGVWFDAVHKGYTLFCDNLNGVMECITGQKWQNITLNLQENGQAKPVRLVVSENFLNNGFFNDIQGLDDLALDGEIIEKTISNAIKYGGCILLSDAEEYSFDRNTTKLSHTSTQNLPLMSFPIKKGDKQTLNDLAISYKSAEYELQNLNNFDENNDDNFYFRQYKKLTDYLRGAISTAQKDKMVIDRDFLFSQYGAGLGELYKDQLNKLQEDMTTLEQECIQGQEMQK